MKNIMLKIWFVWESIFEKLAGIHPVPGGFFRIAIRRYRGDKLTCLDGTILNPGEKYGELHLNNKFFIGLSKQDRSPAFLGIASLRESKKAFSSLKEYTKSNPLFKDVNVFMGYTLLNRGINRLGFEVHDIKSGFIKNLVSNYEKMLLAILHPEGFKRVMSKKLVSKQVLITKKTLEKLY
ncbi:hypothetical protein D2962_15045 [Biomaibacter acetigenes]|uniref:YkoP-like domain-containing protein n=1 Tax=Biomaibacter acetigenes TaxID=2316383 RepID=A0A3G2R8H0_9FIRM|nr:hypothetical protein [Biomaibacter acetigenes]AYO31736.1 hypothetical protein D2962_15045 [Biomaibacter acetigenes]